MDRERGNEAQRGVSKGGREEWISKLRSPQFGKHTSGVNL